MSDIRFPCLETQSYLAYIADNSPLGIHRRGYNGVAALIPRLSGNNLFVPSFAGLNYETISLTGMPTYRHEPTKRDHQSKFEPRCEAMHIESADVERVVLIQPPTRHAGVSARITFRAEEPHYLHQRIELSFLKRFCGEGEPSQFTSLWASYVHTPPDRHVYLKSDWQADSQLAGWLGITKADHTARDYQVRSLTAERLDAASHLAAMSGRAALTEAEVASLPQADWPPISPPHPQRAPLVFYYGLCHGDQMLLKIFRPSDRFQLAYSPCGGGDEPAWSPAWDYVLHLDDASVGSTHAWDLCVVLKKFQGREDVLREVRRYLELELDP